MMESYSILKRLYKYTLRGIAALPGNIKAKLKGAKLGYGTNVSWNAVFYRSKNSEIVFGENCLVHYGAIIAPYNNGSIVFGNNCSINPYCIIYGHGGLRVGDNVRIAAHTVVIPANHDFFLLGDEVVSNGLHCEGIVIESDVWIGAGVRILDGVTIHRGSIIAAGAVVVRSTDGPGVYAGVPATLKRRNVGAKGPRR